MNRSFYSYAIVFFALYVIVSFFQSIIFFQLGVRVYELPSVKTWSVFIFLLGLGCSLIMMKYYRYRQFQFAYWTLIISVAASCFHFISFFRILQTREIAVYFILAVVALLVTGMLHSVSLIFSEAGKKHWLRAIGVYSLALELVALSSTLWALTSIAVRLNGTIESIEQWTALAGSFGPVFLIMNCLRERTVAEKMTSSRNTTLKDMMGFALLVAGVSAVILIPIIALQSRQLLANPNAVSTYVSDLAEPFEARTYVSSDGDTLRYRLMIPLKYDSATRYPLVICLHGSSGSGTDNVKQVITSLPALMLSAYDIRMKYPAFLFVPQCPPKAGWGGIDGQTSVDSLVFETIDALEKEFHVDVRRRYVAGNSMGGYGAWYFASTRPQMFAAAIPICGGGDPELARNLVDVPVWAFHGADDRNVPVSGSRDMIRAIKHAGGDPRYTEYPDEGHNIGDKVKATPDLLPWLFGQKRR
jgi:pimeloyl-ACP methyl ester carboxylesterase